MIDQFCLENEPLSKLVSSYIELEQTYDKGSRVHNQKKQTLFLNSILISLATKKATLSAVWNEIKYCLEVNNSDRECLRRGAQLLLEVFKRNPNCLHQTPNSIIFEIITLSCQKAFITICGNDFISLIQHLTLKFNLNSSEMEPVVPLLLNFFASNKLQVNTYRQETRLCLYKILLRLLSLEPKRLTLLEKSVRAGEGEKDPRNIGAVFELYLKMLQIYAVDDLIPYRAAMFQNIEAYYPIQFVGDEDNQEHRKVSLHQISGLLDQCLCHPFFSELSWELLSAKTAAPPLAPFISTLLAYFESIRRCPNNQLNSRLASLLFRFSEEDFIAQQYEQHAAVDISTVIEGLLDVIFCRENNTFDFHSFETVRNWLHLMIGRVTNGECHHSGTMMGIFRSVISKSKTSRFGALVELLRTFSLRAILKTINDGQIIPKLGLAVVVVTDAGNSSEDVKEFIGLLVLKIGSLYSTVSDEVKLLLLKILLQIYKSSESNRFMVRKVNDGLILKDILARAQIAFANCPNQNQAYLIKAFIDFVSTVYINQIDLLLQHINGVNYELEAYLLARLWENSKNKEIEQQSITKSKIISKLNQLIQILSKTEESQNLVKGLKIINKSALLQLILSANWQKPAQHQTLIFSILLGLRQQIYRYESDLQYDFSQEHYIGSLAQNIAQFYLKKNQQNLLLSKEEQLWRALAKNSEKITFPLFSQIKSFDTSGQLLDRFISSYPPTFIQWYWQQLRSRQDSELKSKRLSQMLNFLPEKLLVRDRKQVLSLILSNSKSATSLLKIVKHIEIETIKSTGIIQYCLQYIESLREQPNQQSKTTQRNACILATLISVAERDKTGQLKQFIRKSEKNIKELRLHRKRPVRQAVRKLLSCLQQ